MTILFQRTGQMTPAQQTLLRAESGTARARAPARGKVRRASKAGRQAARVAIARKKKAAPAKLVKGSAAAKAWGAKMRRARKAKSK